MYPKMIFEIASVAKHFVTNVALQRLLLMEGFNMASQIGGRPRFEPAMLAQKPSPKMQRPVSVKLAWIRKHLGAYVAREVFALAVCHHVVLVILLVGKPPFANVALPRIEFVYIAHMIYKMPRRTKNLFTLRVVRRA